MLDMTNEQTFWWSKNATSRSKGYHVILTCGFFNRIYLENRRSGPAPPEDFHLCPECDKLLNDNGDQSGR